MSSYLTCSGCAHTFSSERAFVAHRTGAYAARGPRPSASQRRCLRSADELRAAGLVEHTQTAGPGSRVVWTMAASVHSWEARRARFSATPDTKYAASEAPVPAAAAQAPAQAQDGAVA